MRLVSLTVFPAWQLSPSLPGRTTCGGVAATATRCGHLSGESVEGEATQDWGCGHAGGRILGDELKVNSGKGLKDR